MNAEFREFLENSMIRACVIGIGLGALYCGVGILMVLKVYEFSQKDPIGPMYGVGIYLLAISVAILVLSYFWGKHLKKGTSDIKSESR